MANGPEYHYFQEPYPILSFLYGLYCDDKWSKTEFDKWKASWNGEVYTYEEYLAPYKGLKNEVKTIFSTTVLGRSKKDPKTGRLRPEEDFCEEVYEKHIFAELLRLPPAKRSADAQRRAVKFDPRMPALSGLALLYLEGSPALAREAFARVEQPELRAALLEMIDAHTSASANLEKLLTSDPLRKALVRDFTMEALFPW